MIGKITKGSGFAGLVRYLETGKDGASPDRVDWIEARNLPTDDPRTAGILMRATAHESDRVEKPVYHLAISFDHGDPVDRAAVSGVADRVLSDLGLEEHQVLMVAHRDKEHAHVHLAINRVHPETGRAWDPSYDYARVEQSLRRQERELGLREVPGHHFKLAGHEPPDRADALTTGQLRKWERTGDMPFDELVRKTVVRDFLEATSWEDLEQRLARHALRLQPRGRGLVVTDGAEVVKVSSVTRGASRNKLEQRYGAMYADYRESREREPDREPARTTEAGQRAAHRTVDGRAAGDVDRAAAEAERSGREDRPAVGRDRGTERDAVERDRGRGAPEQPSNGRGGDPARRIAAEHGRDGAERDLPGGTAEATGRPRAVDANERDPFGSGSRDPRRDRGIAGDPDLDGVTRLLAKLEGRIELEKTRDRAHGELHRARACLAPLTVQRGEARDTARRFSSSLGKVYGDRVAARRAVQEFAHREGNAAAAREVAAHPERFGQLRGTEIGPIRSAERKQAIQHAQTLSHATGDYLGKTAAARAQQREYRNARASVDQAETKLRTLDTELGRGAGVAQLRLQIGQKMRALQPQRRHEMNLRLSSSERMLLGTTMAVGLAFAREQGHER